MYGPVYKKGSEVLEEELNKSHRFPGEKPGSIHHKFWLGIGWIIDFVLLIFI
jgi:hypothetical protein